MIIRPFGNKSPILAEDVFIAENAIIIGDVTIGQGSSIWYSCVLRGDVNYIRIGSRTNIQDGTIVHVTSGRFPVEIGDEVTIGHGCIVHSCRIENTCLIGMGAVVLDGSNIGHGAIIAAGSVIREGFQVPPFSLIAGVPAEIKRQITESEYNSIKRSAERYGELSKKYRGNNEREKHLNKR